MCGSGGDCWGLHSKDPTLRSRSQQRCALCCLTCTLLVLLLTFLVIIPAVVTNMVKRSDLVLVSLTISDPTNTSFASVTGQKFTHDSGGGLAARARLGATDVQWTNPDADAGINTLPLVCYVLCLCCVALFVHVN